MNLFSFFHSSNSTNGTSFHPRLPDPKIMELELVYMELEEWKKVEWNSGVGSGIIEMKAAV